MATVFAALGARQRTDAYVDLLNSIYEVGTYARGRLQGSTTGAAREQPFGTSFGQLVTTVGGQVGSGTSVAQALCLGRFDSGGRMPLR